MQYPSKLDYDNAVWNLSKTVRCSEFRRGVPRNDGLDLEHYTGGFSRVYLIDINNRTVVLRAWLNEIPNVQALYTQAEKFLSEYPNPYFVNFHYIEQGIEVNRYVWPVLYMEWVNGQTLNRFLDSCLPHSTKQVENVGNQFLNLVSSLHQARISHGDLQNGNILVTNTTETLGLKLIDYDTLYISGFKDIMRKTVGVSGYQHPKRTGQVVRNLKWDYFSELVIYLSLRVYTEKPQLWIPNKEKALLFSKTDFENTITSPIFKTLNTMSEEIRRLSEQLAAYCNETDLNQLQPLEKVVSNTQRVEVLVSHETLIVPQKSISEEQNQTNLIESDKKVVSNNPKEEKTESRKDVSEGQKPNKEIYLQQQQKTQSAPKSPSCGFWGGIIVFLLSLFLFYELINSKTLNVSSILNWQDSRSQINSGDTVIMLPSTLPVTSPSATYALVSTLLPTPTKTPSIDTPTGMVFIPEGKFSMGTTENEMTWHLNSCNHYASCNKVDYVDMMPRHSVKLRPYFIDMHEVTNADYRACVDAGVCGVPNSSAIARYLAKDYYTNRAYDQYPVVAISWNNAVNYCNWAGGKRLPTEAEWERAAKGNEDNFFPWARRPDGYSAESVFGSKIPLANFCDQDCPMQNWNDSRLNDGWKGPAPVMSFAPGPFGIYDMSGNVTEWIQDYYGANYYSYSPLEDPVNELWSEWHVTRGGGWNNGIYHLTSVFRSAQSPNDPKAFIGFRCVKDLKQ